MAHELILIVDFNLIFLTLILVFININPVGFNILTLICVFNETHVNFLLLYKTNLLRIYDFCAINFKINYLSKF